MKNSALTEAKRAKKNEFYTQYKDIEKEMNSYLDYDPNVFKKKTILLPCDDPEWSNFTKYFAQNFQRLGIKKLISTSYAVESKNYKDNYQPSLFEKKSKNYNKKKTRINGKIFTLTRDITKDGKINLEDLEWNYLKGDGDFRSDEIKSLRDKSDIIITNPPFTLFREFIKWIMDSKKKFSIIGNVTAIGTKIVFPLIMKNKIWLGPSISSGDREFQVPDDYPLDAATWRVDNKGNKFLSIKGVRWYTNLDHGRRHKKLSLMTLKDNLKFSKHNEIRSRKTYEKYLNYNAIEIPFVDSIPSDYKGVMGVPVTFLDKHTPSQFEIIGMCENEDLYNLKTKKYTSEQCKEAYLKRFNKKGTYDLNASGVVLRSKLLEKVYTRVLIRHKIKNANKA